MSRDYFDKRKEELGTVLMKAFDIGIELNDYNLCDFVKKKIVELELPNILCVTKCGTLLTFFDYHQKQGICDACAEKMSKEAEEE